jgi:hypothetical protein
MCVYSTIVDYERKHVHEHYPWVEPYIYTSPNTNPPPWILPIVTEPFVPGGKTVGLPTPEGPTREEVDALRKELKDLRKLLKAATKFDEKTNQPDCESEEKVAFLRKLAELFDVDLSEVLP